MKRIVMVWLMFIMVVGGLTAPSVATAAQVPITPSAVALHKFAGAVKLPKLHRGDLGPFVIMLQALLNDERTSRHPLKMDGIFGRGTQDAVKQYQRSESDECLRTDGVVDDATWKSITTLD